MACTGCAKRKAVLVRLARTVVAALTPVRRPPPATPRRAPRPTEGARR